MGRLGKNPGPERPGFPELRLSDLDSLDLPQAAGQGIRLLDEDCVDAKRRQLRVRPAGGASFGKASRCSIEPRTDRDGPKAFCLDA